MPAEESELLLEYAAKALSIANREELDGDWNCRYRLLISMAEMGRGPKDGAFAFHAEIPRQVNNELGHLVQFATQDRAEAIDFLKALIAELERGGNE